MAHKARRRPSWKKKRSKYLNHLKNKLYEKLALEICREIDKEILETLRIYV